MLIGTLTLSITGCSGIRENLGLEKESPDEFAVITRAPLEIPDTLTLPPPVPGMQRPQEKTALSSASEAVLGNKTQKNQTLSSTEKTILKKAGADSTSSNIRNIIDKETEEINERNIPVAKKILKLGGAKPKSQAIIVDAAKELERIKNNKEAGKTILDGETPYIKE